MEQVQEGDEEEKEGEFEEEQEYFEENNLSEKEEELAKDFSNLKFSDEPVVFLDDESKGKNKAKQYYSNVVLKLLLPFYRALASVKIIQTKRPGY